ncbi:MAG: 50S ribosomal protein L15 [Deltaproteobacteria bacterium RBG_13_58_19]|nr:MAG: 50S ribosomal protein L15 [Deltaproteobacteria bacterium RBG_13_58_19]
MRLSELSPSPGSRRKPKRVGRGPGSGQGKTAGRGHKGQRSRAGGGVKPGFEGGQMPLTRRMPKRGFSNVFRRPWVIVNLRDLARFPAESIVDETALTNAGLIKGQGRGIKLLGQGEITIPLVVRVQAVSRQARERIEAAGGRVEVL